MKVLVFAGAGTSVELGVPGMWGMARGFNEHCQQWSVQQTLVQQVLEQQMDLEHLIEVLDRLCGAQPALEMIGETSDMLVAAEEIRSEVEWYVQHSAERITVSDATLMWGSLLRATNEHELTLVTTNYDRAIEVAANAVDVRIDDGFGRFQQSELARWEGFASDDEKTKLIKLHGSTDWYAIGDTGEPVKLRHPMTLYERSELRLPGGPQLKSALILPSREKMLTNAPFPRLLQRFLNEVDNCDLAVFIGSSLRDPHIEQAVRSTTNRVPTFVVNPHVVNLLYGSNRISQHASDFLLSTFPKALSEDSCETLCEMVGQEEATGNGILEVVETLLDSANETPSRCGAVELLEETGMTLDKPHIERLLSDRDVTVARYALSLVPMSPRAIELVEIARRTEHVKKSDHFRDDLNLLDKMLNE